MNETQEIALPVASHIDFGELPTEVLELLAHPDAESEGGRFGAWLATRAAIERGRRRGGQERQPPATLPLLSTSEAATAADFLLRARRATETLPTELAGEVRAFLRPLLVYALAAMESEKPCIAN